jgi:hypothetical protein
MSMYWMIFTSLFHTAIAKFVGSISYTISHASAVFAEKWRAGQHAANRHVEREYLDTAIPEARRHLGSLFRRGQSN